MSEEKVEKVRAVDKKSKIADIEEQMSQLRQPVEGKFEAMMEQKLPENRAAKGVDGDQTKPTLEDVAKNKVGNENPSSMKNLIAQTQEASEKIEAVKSDLQTPNLTIKKPVRKLMRNKLTHVEDSLRVALSKAGIEEEQSLKTADTQKSKFDPVGNFFDHLTHAQSQMDNLGKYLEALVRTDQELSPANMLAIQVKVNHIAQELEFFTNLLNKALESTKALMNVQV